MNVENYKYEFGTTQYWTSKALSWCEKTSENIDSPMPGAWLSLGDILNYNFKKTRKTKQKIIMNMQKSYSALYKKDAYNKDAIRKLKEVEKKLQALKTKESINPPPKKRLP